MLMTAGADYIVLQHAPALEHSGQDVSTTSQLAKLLQCIFACMQSEPSILLDHSVLVGGCDELVALHKSGQLQLKLEKALSGKSKKCLTYQMHSETEVLDTGSAVDLHAKRPMRSLFWFPDVTDNRYNLAAACGGLKD